MARQRVVPTRPPTVCWALGWDEALAEARVRNVPIVVCMVKGKEGEDTRADEAILHDPALVALLNDRAVALLGRKHQHQQRGPCPEHASIVDCRLHDELFRAQNDRLPTVGGKKDDNYPRMYVHLPDGTLAYRSTRALDEELDDDEQFRQDPGSLLGVLDQVQRRLGDPVTARGFLHSKPLREMRRAEEAIARGDRLEGARVLLGLVRETEAAQFAEARKQWVRTWVGSWLEELVPELTQAVHEEVSRYTLRAVRRQKGLEIVLELQPYGVAEDVTDQLRDMVMENRRPGDGRPGDGRSGDGRPGDGRRRN